MKIIDDNGNLLMVENTKVILRFKKESFNREIGTFEDRVFSKSITKSNQIMKKGNAIGFNYQVIKSLEPQKFVIDIFGSKYEISMDYFEANKYFLHFKQQGFEKQCFIAIDKIKEFKNNLSKSLPDNAFNHNIEEKIENKSEQLEFIGL